MIDAMTLAEAEMIFDGWRESPPAHHGVQILARLWGYTPPRRSDTPSLAAPPQQMLARLGPGFRAGDVHAGLGAAVLDIVKLRRRSRAGAI